MSHILVLPPAVPPVTPIKKGLVLISNFSGEKLPEVDLAALV
tara:strand:- start:139 stop:264 length:126 start_codon:yes stop_codon:yes gene_type:complete